MNTLDMHTREQVNKIHIAEMQRNARHRQLLRDTSSGRTLVFAREKRRALLVALLVMALFGSILVAAVASS